MSDSDFMGSQWYDCWDLFVVADGKECWESRDSIRSQFEVADRHDGTDSRRGFPFGVGESGPGAERGAVPELADKRSESSFVFAFTVLMADHGGLVVDESLELAKVTGPLEFVR